MTLPPRHRVRNSSSDGLRPSPLPLGHGGSPQFWIFTIEREETICFLETWRQEWGSNPRSPTFQAGSFNHCTRAPARVKQETNDYFTQCTRPQTNAVHSCASAAGGQSTINDKIMTSPSIRNWRRLFLPVTPTVRDTESHKRRRGAHKRTWR